MGGGKTTLLKSLVGFMNPGYTIRVAESSFELNLNNVYPERDIHMMQERGEFSIYDIITGTKKMDTDILIVGEVNEPKIAGAYVQVAQSGSRMAVTTLHHETTEKLIEYLRNALVSEFGISDVMIAEKQVVDILNFDIHMVHDVEGRFYIERITEIIPYEEKEYSIEFGEAAREFFARRTDRRLYRLNNIIEFDKAKEVYKKCGKLSEYTMSLIRHKLSEEKIREIIGEKEEELLETEKGR
jgi:pilus assembly protein CpaF